MYPRVCELITRFTGPGFRSDEDREASIEELTSLGAEGRQCLLQLLTDPDLETRCNAVTAILTTYGPDGQPDVFPLLCDPDHVVRWSTCGTLSAYGDGDAVSALVERLRVDEDAAVRGLAAHALGCIASRGITIPPFALVALQEAVERDHELDNLGYSASSAAKGALAEIREVTNPD